MRKRLKVEKATSEPHLANKNRILVREEHCANPWNGKCNNTNIALYIYFRGERLPICWPCWNDITEKDVEWGEEFA